MIAATNRDLNAAMGAGAFRSDLFYRLNVFPIEMPALRERQEDIPLLVAYFVDRYARKVGKTIENIDERTFEILQGYGWPGNIRELQNVIERFVIICESETFAIDELAAPGIPEAAAPGSVARGRPRRPGERDDRDGTGCEPGARVRAVRGGGKARHSRVDPDLEDQGTGHQEGAVQARVNGVLAGRSAPTVRQDRRLAGAGSRTSSVVLGSEPQRPCAGMC